jgi:hypothetical protein
VSNENLELLDFLLVFSGVAIWSSPVFCAAK